MKKITFIAGLLSTMFITIGLVLRATLGTNASGDINKILIGSGLLGLAIIFVPGLLVSTSTHTATGKMPLKVLLASLIPLAIGWGFKLFHTTGANELVLLGTAIFIFGFLPLAFKRMYEGSIG